MPEKVHEFRSEVVTYIETTYPNDDVECDVYKYDHDPERDLAIVQVKPRGKTPKQRMLLGKSTIEGHISGRGELTVNDTAYQFPHASLDEIEVKVGDIMQWHAGEDKLIFYEICKPPYTNGRFEDIAT